MVLLTQASLKWAGRLCVLFLEYKCEQSHFGGPD